MNKRISWDPQGKQRYQKSGMEVPGNSTDQTTLHIQIYNNKSHYFV